MFCWQGGAGQVWAHKWRAKIHHGLSRKEKNRKGRSKWHSEMLSLFLLSLCKGESPELGIHLQRCRMDPGSSWTAGTDCVYSAPSCSAVSQPQPMQWLVQLVKAISAVSPDVERAGFQQQDPQHSWEQQWGVWLTLSGSTGTVLHLLSHCQHLWCQQDGVLQKLALLFCTTRSQF